jgi:hypothetical protein
VAQASVCGVARPKIRLSLRHSPLKSSQPTVQY